MKKFILFVITGLLSYNLSAQDAPSDQSEITSKKGETYLPEAGDWAIGVNASPFFRYLGNAFNGNTGNGSPTFSYTDGMSIYGKYFKSADFAYRAKLRFLGINNHRDLGFVSNDLAVNPNDLVQDSWDHSQMEIGIGVGFEKRRGKTRLQGFYGAEVNLMFGSATEKFKYGNEMTATNATPTTYDFGENSLSPAMRVTEIKRGTHYFFGVRPYIGVEYFFLPKMSIGGEFGINLGTGASQADQVTVQYYDAATASVVSSTSKQNEDNVFTFVIDNDNLSGALKLLFHF